MKTKKVGTKFTALILASLMVITGMVMAGFAEAQGQTTIRYMTWEDSDWQKLTTELIAEFEAENPDIKIVYEPVAGDGY